MELPSTGIKELKSGGKIFIKCPYDFASEVRYIVNVRKFEPVKKKSATPVILPQICLWLAAAAPVCQTQFGALSLVQISPDPLLSLVDNLKCWHQFLTSNP